RVLWANQVMTAKSLYLQLQYDQMLLVRVQSGRGDMERIHEIVKNREALGGYPAGTSREIEIRLLALDEDVRALKALIADEVSVLGIMLGYGATARVQIDPVELVDFEQHTPVRYDDYEKRVLNASSEIRQFYYLENAARQVRREVSFSIFGVSTLSRGVASGVFDNVPIQDGLGFGTAASIKISKAQVQTIALQRQGVAETLKRQLMQAVTNYNLDIANYPGVKKRVSLAKAVNEQLFERLRLGGDVDMLNLLEGSRNYIQAGTSKLNAQIRFLRNQDKIFRLALTSDYSGDPLSGRKP
ncbi:MAG: TolC family protein, partial [Pseudobdellovibrionaceae bacterium]